MRFIEAPESSRALIIEEGEKPVRETVRRRQGTVRMRTIFEAAGLCLKMLASSYLETASFPEVIEGCIREPEWEDELRRS